MANELQPINQIVPGVRNDPNSCPIANSLHELGIRATGTYLGRVPWNVALRLEELWEAPATESSEGFMSLVSPPEFKQFMEQFDRGYFPELDLKRGS